MSETTVSCVVPVHDGERHLADALDSVLGQTRPPDEVIVVDDGSTDGSPGVIERYRRHVICIRQACRGPASARNHGVRASSGALVAFIDQDDLWQPEKLERQLACFAVDPGLDLCFSRAERFWEPGLHDEGRAQRGQPRGWRVPAYTTPALLARRAAFDRVGPLDEGLRFADATDWTLRAIDAGLRIALLPDALLRHRMHDANLTRDREASGAEFVRTVKATLDRRRAGGARL